MKAQVAVAVFVFTILSGCARYDTIVVDVPVDQRILPLRPLTFHAASSDVTWNFGDGSTAKGTTVSHAFERAGSFQVSTSDGHSIQVGVLDIIEANASLRAPLAQFSELGTIRIGVNHTAGQFEFSLAQSSPFDSVRVSLLDSSAREVAGATTPAAPRMTLPESISPGDYRLSARLDQGTGPATLRVSGIISYKTDV